MATVPWPTAKEERILFMKFGTYIPMRNDTCTICFLRYGEHMGYECPPKEQKG